MDVRISPALQRYYAAAEAWYEDRIHGGGDTTPRDVIEAIDREARDLDTRRSSPDHRGWQEAARQIIDRATAKGFDPIGYALAQVRDAKTGVRWLAKRGIPFTYRHLLGPKAASRHLAHRIQRNRDQRLTDLYGAGQVFVETYFLGEGTMFDADDDARATLPTWSRAEVDELPHLRWLLHQHAVYLLDCDLRHVPILDAPEKGWTYPGERLRLHRLIAQHRPAPVEEPRPRRRTEPLPEDLGTVFSAEDMGQISDEDDEDGDE